MSGGAGISSESDNWKTRWCGLVVHFIEREEGIIESSGSIPSRTCSALETGLNVINTVLPHQQ